MADLVHAVPKPSSDAGHACISAIPQESLCNRRFLPSPQPSPCKGEGAIIPQELLWLCTRNDVPTLDPMNCVHRTRMETLRVSTSDSLPLWGAFAHENRSLSRHRVAIFKIAEPSSRTFYMSGCVR